MPTIYAKLRWSGRQSWRLAKLYHYFLQQIAPIGVIFAKKELFLLQIAPKGLIFVL